MRAPRQLDVAAQPDVRGLDGRRLTGRVLDGPEDEERHAVYDGVQEERRRAERREGDRGDREPAAETQ